MRLIAIGRLRDGPEYKLFERYNARLRPRMSVTELPEQRGTALVIRRREAAELLEALPKQAFVVALDLGGQVLDSVSFSQRLDHWSGLARTVCFLIGGAEGLDDLVLNHADYMLSLGAMTWPHFLARVMLIEQIFRARSILSGHPYHRACRPLA